MGDKRSAAGLLYGAKRPRGLGTTEQQREDFERQRTEKRRVWLEGQQTRLDPKQVGGTTPEARYELALIKAELKFLNSEGSTAADAKDIRARVGRH